MKSSIKFREEKSPLLRSKLPFKLGPLPLSSGLALGTKQELAVHLATGFPAGPIIKLAIKPHDPNPLSVILKAGLGLWGSPTDAPLTLTAEICFTPNGRDRAVALRIKPRAGDFSIRKDVRNVNLFSAQSKEAATRAPVCPQVCENKDENQAMTPQKADHGFSIHSPLVSGEAKSLLKPITHSVLDKEHARSISVDSSNVLIGSNISSKIEGLEKGRNDRKPKRDLLKEQDIEGDMSGDGNSVIVHSPNDMLHSHKKVGSRKLAASFPLAGARDVLCGCKLVTHSSFPLGNQAKLKVRWGIKSSADFFQGWDGSLPSVSFSKLPSLVLDKVSFEQVAPKLHVKTSGPPAAMCSFEQGLLPSSFVEENRELAEVASMCFAMKRQLHLMHAENQVLRRAMEEMRLHAGTKGSWVPNGLGDSMPTTSSQSVPRLPSKPSFLDTSGSHRDVLPGKESSRRDTQGQKAQKGKPKKDEESQSNIKFPADDSMDVSKELERAILSAQVGSGAGKKE